MSDAPWLTIIGVGEDGPAGLSPASAAALSSAEIVVAPPRHLSLIPTGKPRRIEWPVPFADGLPLLDGCRGTPTALLASGDPFWFGAGRVIAERYDAQEWRALPGPSTFSIAAARLGWGLEKTICLGLHAASLWQVRPHLADGARIFVLVRDGEAARELANLLRDLGFGESQVGILEALGGPSERVRFCSANDVPDDIAHPVLVAIEARGTGGLPVVPGRSDQTFDTDGQITRAPIRAMTLGALSPKPGELLWDIGGGSGAIAIEWALAHPRNRAISVEARPDRANRIALNAEALGTTGVDVVTGTAPEALEALPKPHAVFVGGGLSEGLLEFLQTNLRKGTRLVANAVTVESEALLTEWQSNLGGELLRIEMSNLVPLGPKRGWKAEFPIVQWVVTL